MTVRTAAPIALAALGAVLLAACGGGSGSATKVRRVDRKQVEGLVVQREKERNPALRIGTATCPSDVEARVGETFTCTVEVEGQVAHVNVTVSEILGAEARYDLRPVEAVVDVTSVVAFVRSRLEADWQDARVDCGAAKARVTAVGSAIECSVFNGITTRYIQAVVEDSDGSVSLRER